MFRQASAMPPVTWGLRGASRNRDSVLQPGALVQVDSNGVPDPLSAVCFDVRGADRLDVDAVHTLGIPEPLGLNAIVEVLADIVEDAAGSYDQAGVVNVTLHAFQDQAKPCLHSAEGIFNNPACS